MRCLVYYACDERFSELLQLSVASVREHAPDADVAVLCGSERMQACCKGLARGGEILALPVAPPALAQQSFQAADGALVSMRKAKAFDIPGIHDYDAVLYLDADTLVNASLEEVWKGIAAGPGKLHVCEEGPSENHAMGYWSLGSPRKHSHETLEALADDAVGVFNCGQMGFVPTSAMRSHFLAVQALMAEHSGPYFWEQSFFNHYFCTQRLTDGRTLTPRTLLAARGYDGSKAIAHFSDASKPPSEKMWLMLSWLAQKKCSKNLEKKKAAALVV